MCVLRTAYLGFHPSCPSDFHISSRSEISSASNAATGGDAEAHRLEGERRDDDRLLGARLHGNVGQGEELAPRVRPARRFDDPSRCLIGFIEPIEPGIGVGLREPAIMREMAFGMRAAAVNSLLAPLRSTQENETPELDFSDSGPTAETQNSSAETRFSLVSLPVRLDSLTYAYRFSKISRYADTL